VEGGYHVAVVQLGIILPPNRGAEQVVKVRNAIAVSQA
jgi:hypothetical protein